MSGAKAIGIGSFLGSGPQKGKGEFRQTMERGSFEFGRVVEHGDEQQIIEALACTQALLTMQYSLLAQARFDVNALQAAAQQMVKRAMDELEGGAGKKQ
ncbi:MAG: hypothetical protein C4519_19820 [Desulfobacteraceae bacterium]|nr:MAG: hypothetical protein C4519_19820 [Desulfobacteraceae bacterium]